MSFPRFPRYRDSSVDWLGELPEHWQVKTFRHVATIRNGGDHRPFEVAEGGYPVLGSGGEFARASRYLYSCPSVLLGRKGTIDNPLYIDAPFWTVDTLYYTEVAADVDPKYLYYFCRTIPFDRFQYGSAVPSMTQRDIYSISVPVPPLAEQSSIARFLDREIGEMERLIAEQQRLIGLLREKRRAVISHAVTNGLNGDAQLKPSGVEWLGDVPAHWEVRSLTSTTTKITNGYVGPTRDILVDEGVRYLQSLHIKGNRISFVTPYFVTEAWSHEHKKSILQTGDVLVVQTGDIGQVAVVTPEFAGSNCHALIVVSPMREQLDGEWLSWCLNSDYGFHTLLSIQTGALHPHLNCGNVKSVMIPVPPLKEQRLIVNYITRQVEELDALTTEAERIIELLRERRAALVSAAVTGKIDVSGLADVDAEAA